MSQYQELFKFRQSMFRRFIENKSTIADFVHGSFNYLNQNKIRHIAKPANRDEALLNYLFWQIHIERKVIMEKELIDQNLGSKEYLDKAIFMYIKRRDQMIRRIFFDFQEPIQEAYIIYDDVVEIILKDGQILYSTLESLSKIKINVQMIKKSIQPKYLPAIRLK